MLETSLLIACALGILGWWILLPARAVLHDRMLGRLSQMSCAEPARWPPVSVLVPANNEESTLAGAVQSLLEVDYPELEFILVDDRSSDRTGEIMARLAARDARVRELRIDILPEGWLGKVYALQRGVEASHGAGGVRRGAAVDAEFRAHRRRGQPDGDGGRRLQPGAARVICQRGERLQRQAGQSL